MIRKATTLLAVLLSLTSLTTAQTTHTVTLSGAAFSPSTLDVQVGDTVLWQWVSGNHNVESGVGGVPDGIFSSGVPVLPPATFSVTFDQAFLNANPVAGDSYDYYCSVHVGFGMSGVVNVQTVSAGVPALPVVGLVVLGGGVAAAASLLLSRRRGA